MPSDKQTYSGYLGGDALDAILGVRQCPVRSMTMCVTSPAELSKCVRMRTAMKAQLLQPEMSCYRADTNYGCMRVRAPTSFSLSRTSFLICRNAGHPRRLGRRDHDGRRRRLLGRPALWADPHPVRGLQLGQTRVLRRGRGQGPRRRHRTHLPQEQEHVPHRWAWPFSIKATTSFTWWLASTVSDAHQLQ